MSKFSEKVRSLIREYVPSDQLSRYNEVTKETDRTKAVFNEVLAKPSANGAVDKVYACAFSYSMSVFDENRVARQMLATIADALMAQEDDLVVLQKAVPFEPLRMPSTQSNTGFSLTHTTVATPEQRDAILTRARESTKEREKIGKQILPIRTVRLRCLSYLKAVDSRELAMFPHYRLVATAPIPPTAGRPVHSSDVERCQIFAADRKKRLEDIKAMSAFDRKQLAKRIASAKRLAEREAEAREREAKRREEQVAKQAKRRA